MELWDIYDAYRHKTGRTGVRGEPVLPGDYHLVVHLIVFNAAGQMLIQQRQSCKRSCPDMWDITVGGCAVVGESSQEAAMRELREELGLEIDLTDTAPDLMITFPGGFDDMFLLERELDPAQLHLQQEEVQAARWASREEIMAMLRDNTFVPYHPSMIDMLFDLRSHGGGLTREVPPSC